MPPADTVTVPPLPIWVSAIVPPLAILTVTPEPIAAPLSVPPLLSVTPVISTKVPPFGPAGPPVSPKLKFERSTPKLIR